MPTARGDRGGSGIRVAVTGATGNVGSAVVRHLLADDRVAGVVGLARRRPDPVPPGVDWVTADVVDGDLRAAFEGCDAVVHLAWAFHPTRHPYATWQANVVGSQRVFDAAVAAGASALVHASSVGAYSPGAGRRVTEDWPTDSHPGAAYGREKSYVERVLDTVEATHRDLRVVRLRPAFIFQKAAASEQRRIFAGPFVPGFVARRGVLPILPYPRGLTFQALHVDDVARAYQLALHTEVRGAFNIASEPPLDGDRLGELLGARPVRVSPWLVRQAMAAAWRAHLAPADPALFDLVTSLPLLDTSRARTELGWEPTTSAPDAVAELLEGIREGAGGATPPLTEDSVAGRVQEVATGVGASN